MGAGQTKMWGSSQGTLFNKTSVNKFTNTVKEHFSENSSLKYLTLFLVLFLIALILYCLLNDKLNL